MAYLMNNRCVYVFMAITSMSISCVVATMPGLKNLERKVVLARDQQEHEKQASRDWIRKIIQDHNDALNRAQENSDTSHRSDDVQLDQAIMQTLVELAGE